MHQFHLRVFAALLLSSAASAALCAPASQDAATPGTSVQTVQEVVVTARKRAERLIDVPAPVSAVSKTTLDQSGATRFQDYLTTVPGANFSSSRDGATVLILRGISTGSANPTVATYVDEAPFGSSTIFALGSALTPDLDPADIEQVEVLRGPQGTLYGANAIGGILKFVTVKPDPNTFSGQVEAGFQSVENGGVGGEARGSLNLPLVTDKLAVRISGYDRDDPGFIDDVFHKTKGINDARVQGGRIDLLWTPTADLSVRLSALAHDSQSDGANNVDIQQVQTDPDHGRLAGWTYGDLDQHRYMAQPLDVNYRLYNGTVTWKLPGATLVSSTTYSTEHVDQTTDETASYAPGLHALSPALFPSSLGVTLLRAVAQQKLTEELRLSSSGSQKLDWQVGAFVTHERSSADDPVYMYLTPSSTPYVLPPPFTAYNNLFHATLFSQYTEFSGFGDLDYHFTKAFDVLVGVRESYDAQTYSQPSSGVLYGPPSTSHSTGYENAFTFLVNPRWKIDDANMVYARIASGYRPGGPNAVPPAVLNFPAAFGPDHLYNYELGWKAELLNRKLTLDTSVYYIQWTSMQLPTEVGGYTAEANGGRAHSQGVEEAAVWTPIHGLTLSANATYTDGRIDSVQNPQFVGAFPGDRLPLAPRWSWGLSGDYDWTVVGAWKAYVGATYRNVGERPNVFAVNSATSGYYVPLPGYDTLDLRAGVTEGPWALQLFVKNAADSRGVLSAGPNGLSIQSRDWTASVLTPRTVGMTLSRKF